MSKQSGLFYPKNSPYISKYFQPYTNYQQGSPPPISSPRMPISNTHNTHNENHNNHMSISIGNRLQAGFMPISADKSVEFIEKRQLQAKIESMEKDLNDLMRIIQSQNSSGELTEKLIKQVAQLKSELNIQRSSIKNIEEELQRTRTSKKLIQNDIYKQRDTIRQLQQELNSQIELSHQMKIQLETSQAHNQELRKSLRLMGEQMKSFGEEMYESRNLVNNSKQETSKMQQQIMVLSSKLQHLEKQYSAITAEKQFYRNNYQQKLNAIEVLRLQANTLRKENDEFQKDRQNSTEANKHEKNRMTTTINHHQQQSNKLNQHLTNYREREKTLQNQITQMNQQILGYKSKQELNRTQSQVKFNIISDSYAFQIQNKRIKRELLQLNQRDHSTREKYRQIIQRLQQKQTQANQQSHQFRSEARRLQTIIQQKEFQCQQLLSKDSYCSQLWAQKEAHYQKEITELGKRIYSLEEQKIDAQTRSREMRDKVEELLMRQTIYKEQSSKLVCLQKQVQQEQRFWSLNKQQYQITIKAYEKNADKYNQNLNSIQYKMNELESQRKQIDNQLSRYKIQIVPRYQQQINYLQTTIAQLEDKLRTVSQSMIIMEGEVKKVQSENAGLYSKIKQLQALQQETFQKKDALSQQFAIYKQQQQRATKEYSNTISNLGQQLNFHKIDNSSIKSQVKRLENQLAEIEKKRRAIIEQNGQRKNENNKMRHQYQIISQQHQKLIDKCEGLISTKRQQQKLQSAAVQHYSKEAKLKLQQIHHLQAEILALKKKMVENQHSWGRTKLQLEQEIEKSKIENLYHRATIQKLFREGTNRLKSEHASTKIKQHIASNLKQLNDALQRQKAVEFDSYIEYSEYKEQHLRSEQRSIEPQNLFNQVGRNRDRETSKKDTSVMKSERYRRSQQISQFQSVQNYPQNSRLFEQNADIKKRLQRANKDIGRLKACVDQHLAQNNITPRQASTCAISRTIWLVQILSTSLKQYSQDLKTIKLQKKDIIAQKHKLQMLVEGLELEKERLIAEIQVMLERIRYLQGHQNEENLPRRLSNQNLVGSKSYSLKGNLKNNNQGLKNHNSLKVPIGIKLPVQFTFGSEALCEGIELANHLSQLGKQRSSHFKLSRPSSSSAVPRKHQENHYKSTNNLSYGVKLTQQEKKVASEIVIIKKQSNKQDILEGINEKIQDNNIGDIPKLKFMESTNINKFKEERKKILQMMKKDIKRIEIDDYFEGDSNTAELTASRHEYNTGIEYRRYQSLTQQYLFRQQHSDSNQVSLRDQNAKGSQFDGPIEICK